MSQSTAVEGNLITYTEASPGLLDGADKKGLFLKLGTVAGTVEIAGLGEQELIFVSKLKDGDSQVLCRSLSGSTAIVRAGGVIAYGTEVNSDANGKAAAGAGGMKSVTAASSAADDLITVQFV